MSTKTMKILTFIATILLVISLGTSTIFALTPSQVQPTDPGTNDIQTFRYITNSRYSIISNNTSNIRY